MPQHRQEYAGSLSDERQETQSDAQIAWAQKPIAERLQVIEDTRHRIAARADEFAQAISPGLARTKADTLVAEVLPLLAAAKFLEQRAAKTLRPRRLGRRGLPFWLAGIDCEVQRVPFGRVLVIGPSNYPLYLPGVQTLQGLTAGNAVVWKPGRGGRAVAELFAETIYAAGLPRELLRVTDESAEAAENAMASGVDKVFFTGSAAVGQQVLKRLAGTLTPCVAELSGCDAMIVLPSADFPRVVQAIAFAMRLNGAATCMAPRRVLLVDSDTSRRNTFFELLQRSLQTVQGLALSEPLAAEMTELLHDAQHTGASILGNTDPSCFGPVIVANGSPAMKIAQADLFLPVITIIDVAGESGVLDAQQTCPFALTASIFGDEAHALRLAAKLTVGTVLINDLIVPTADPRVPFGGRRRSGFGVTRGAEGLLEMAAVKTVSVRRDRSTRHYEAPGEAHHRLFRGVIFAIHAAPLPVRWRGVRETIAAAQRLRKK